MRKEKIAIGAAAFLVAALLVSAKEDGDLKGKYQYGDFETAKSCRQCHPDIYSQWDKSMMSKAYTHEWDEIEYFKLAVAHSQKDPKFKPVADGCNGCHTPFAYLAGDVPPPVPAKGSMANESVSCDFCHTVSGFDESKLFNFSYYVKPGEVKFGIRGGSSPNHEAKAVEYIKSPEFCANCHNEKSPWDVWVKATYNEWKEGPYSKGNVVRCQDCHMPKVPGKRAIVSPNSYPDVRQHWFHGGHVPAKYRGAIDVLLTANEKEFEPGDKAVFKVSLLNQKAGHKIPTGSVEDRLLYLHVTATDSKGNTWHLPVDKKGFEGEEFTIAAEVKAYQDLAYIMAEAPEGFDGLPRDGVPVGDRIFRMPYFSPEGYMTIAQWNTASLGVDYRIGPLESREETYTFAIPDEAALGPLTVRAELRYQLLAAPVAKFLAVPEEEYRDRIINAAETEVEIYF